MYACMYVLAGLNAVFAVVVCSVFAVFAVFVAVFVCPRVRGRCGRVSACDCVRIREPASLSVCLCPLCSLCLRLCRCVCVFVCYCPPVSVFGVTDNMYVFCVYLCMNACMYVCDSCIYVCMYVCMYVCLPVCFGLSVCICLYVPVFVERSGQCT